MFIDLPTYFLGLDPLPTSTRSETVTQKPKASTSKNTSGFWSLSKTIEQKPESDPTTMKANFARLQQQTFRYDNIWLANFARLHQKTSRYDNIWLANFARLQQQSSRYDNIWLA